MKIKVKSIVNDLDRGESIGDGIDDNGSGGSGEVYNGSADPMLDLLSDSYLEEDRIFSVGDNRPSSCPIYTVY